MVSRVIETEADREGIVKYINAQPLPVTVNVVKGKKRTTKQNYLQRLWLNEISDQTGDTTEEVRGFCKLTIGVPIMRAGHDDFAEAYDKNIRDLSYERKLAFMMLPLDFPVTRLMTTKEKTTYLDHVHKLYIEQGIALTDPST